MWIKTLFTNSIERVLMLMKLRVTSATPGRVKFELDVQKEHTVIETRFLALTELTV